MNPNSNDDIDYKKKRKITYYHPLCELDFEEIKIADEKNLLLKRHEDEIKILTYNIFERSLVKNNESDWKEERLEDFCSILHNFDIVCLQEMFGTLNSRKQTLIRAATIAGFFFLVDTSSPDFISNYMVDGGLVILSRFPIVSHYFQKYRYGVIADALSQKGVLYAKIAIKESYLHLFSTHLQASYFDSGEGNFIASFETRLSQLDQVNCIIHQVLEKEYNKQNDKVLFVGDLNVDALGYMYKKPESPLCQEIVLTEYEEMMKRLNNRGLKMVDLYYDIYNSHPITFAEVDPDGSYKETVLTSQHDLGCRQSLDYMMECFYEEDDDKEVTNQKLCIENHVSIERFLVEDLLARGEICPKKNRVYTQLSDHYGLMCYLKYKGKYGKNDDHVLNVKTLNNDTSLYVKDEMKNNNNINSHFYTGNIDESEKLLAI